jgi:hypothetical protein
MISSHQDIIVEAEVSKECWIGGKWESGYLAYV